MREKPSRDDLERRRELDVGPQRVPDRAVRVARQLNRAGDGFVWHIAVDDERDRNGGKAVRIVGRAFRGEVAPERAKRVAPLRQDVRNVHRHATGNRNGERLHGRWTFAAFAVDDDRRAAAEGVENEFVVPGETGGDGRLGHARNLTRPVRRFQPGKLAWCAAERGVVRTALLPRTRRAAAARAYTSAGGQTGCPAPTIPWTDE